MKLKINMNTVKEMAVEFTGQVKEALKPAKAVVQKVIAVVVSGVIAVGCGVPVASAAAEDTIDPSRTGTMIIHKYDVTAAQALDFRRPLLSSPAIERLHEAYRQVVPFIDHDVVMYPHIAKSVEFLKTYPLA